MEREEESTRLKLQKIIEEVEQKRLASEYEQRKSQQILKEIEQRELEEAQGFRKQEEGKEANFGRDINGACIDWTTQGETRNGKEIAKTCYDYGRAKLDEIAEKQRQREWKLEEEERQMREALLGRSADCISRPVDVLGACSIEPVVAAAATAAASTGRYVPRFWRQGAEAAAQAPPPQSDHWGSRPDDRPPPVSDRWCSDDRRPSYCVGVGSRSSTWSSSRNR